MYSWFQLFTATESVSELKYFMNCLAKKEKKKKHTLASHYYKTLLLCCFIIKMEMRSSHGDSSANIPYSKHYAETAPALLSDRKWPRKRECGPEKTKQNYAHVLTLPRLTHFPKSWMLMTRIATRLYYMQTWPAEYHTIVCVCAFRSMVHDLIAWIFHTVKPEPNERREVHSFVMLFVAFDKTQSEALTHWRSVHLKWANY